MPLFDTSVQELKYKVLKEVATLAFDGQLTPESVLEIPERVIPGPDPTMRCCIYKERAIVGHRVRMAMGGSKDAKGVVEVLPIACDECPVDGVRVTEACRGCIAHRCQNVCPKGAISFQNQRAVVDKQKCVECGRCVAACPYAAIVKDQRPCEKACKAGAISMDESRKALIDYNKCISCGHCVYMCPFGAVTDSSSILKAIDLIRGSKENTEYKVYAVTAPSMASQYSDINVEQTAAGIRLLGFHAVVEAALGADMVAYKEASELVEKGFLTSSCCPAFVAYIDKNFPELKPHVSHNFSPMAEIARYLKGIDPHCKVVFIGPCIAKKEEALKERVLPLIDAVLTFEELQALFDAKDIDLKSLDGLPLDNASYYGRVFARSGGLSVAVDQALKEHQIPKEVFDLSAKVCNGILECKTALLMASKSALKENFIEGMVCENGCIGGAACVSHGPKDKSQVDAYGRMSKEQTIQDAIEVLQL